MNQKIAIICPNDGTEEYLFSDNILIGVFSFDKLQISESKSTEIAFHEFLSLNIEKINKADGILISCDCLWQEAMLLLLHLRLTFSWSDEQYIYWDSKNKYSKIAFEATLNNFNKSFIPSNRTHYVNRREISEGLDIYKEIEKKLFSIVKQVEPFNIHQYTVKKPTENSGHQIINEWAAFKLAHTAELYNLLPIIEEKQPRSKTLYFKYLKRKFSIQTGLSNNQMLSQRTPSVKWLLIDDNYAKGWELVLDNIFGQISNNLGLEAFIDSDKINTGNEETIIIDILEKITNQKYQGILLDLRLTSEDDEPNKSNTNIESFTGGRILERLKNEFPFLPVIMVTASNKAWNMQQLLDAGADGYFIKEDPESNPTEEVSKSSYEAFKTLIIECQKKYKTLAPFWRHIKEIDKIDENTTLIQEKTENEVTTKVEERIKERLKMFFGLLKRSFEDVKYNEKFHYSDKSLAFMTLWSCLNDIQYIYYIKNADGTISVNSNLVSHFGIPTNFQKLTFLNSNNKIKTFIVEDRSNNNKTFKIASTEQDGNKINTKIGQQIAFFIYGFSNLDTTKRDLFLTTLFKLKEKRNSLYLTHGDETINYFKKLEKDNDEITIEDCAQLFEIIYFLLKGTYVSIDID